MSLSLHHRLDIINKANDGYITVREASERLGLSERQVQRLKREVKENGTPGIIHKNTHRKPSNALPCKTKEEILSIRSKPGYKSSNFKHFQELLEVNHGIIISYSALYRLLTDDGQKSPKKRRRFKPHRRRRRRPQSGNLIQMDASIHDWFGTGIKYALHGAIDDATGQVTGLYLCRNECMLGYHEVIRRMVTIFGKPQAIYADRHTIFRSPNADKAQAEDAPPGIQAYDTQVGRALNELGISIIAARSAQAKGRIERLWETLQSRLPVELEIEGITSVDDANRFLEGYIFAFNSEFAVEPTDADNAFIPLDEGINLDYILCIKETRTLDHGQVFSYKSKRLQIVKAPYSNYIPPKAKITVMVSPRIGIRVNYLNYVFDTTSAPVRSVYQKKKDNPKVLSAPRSPGRFEPQSGLPWQPGLPCYGEVMEIVQEIFQRPYTKAKGGWDKDVNDNRHSSRRAIQTG